MRKLVPMCGLNNVCLSHHSFQREQFFQFFLGEEPFLHRILQYLVGQSCLKDLSLIHFLLNSSRCDQAVDSNFLCLAESPSSLTGLSIGLRVPVWV